MWTLAEISKIEQDPMRKQVIDSMLMESNLLQIVPFETVGQLSFGITRYQDLPSIGFRNINGALSESTGHFEQKVETLALSGVEIKGICIYSFPPSFFAQIAIAGII